MGLKFLETDVTVHVFTHRLWGVMCTPSGSNPGSRATASMGTALQLTEKEEQPPLQAVVVVELSFAAAKTFWDSALSLKTPILEQFIRMYIYIYIQKTSALEKKKSKF